MKSMQAITLSHLRTHANELKEALKRGEEVELTSHGQVIGIIKPYAAKTDESDRERALHAFFEAGAATDLEQELERIRQGRQGRGHAV
jgi:antitoxin (DNA-binding transcriptional repressor) of toxin-antitoxin stability system